MSKFEDANLRAMAATMEPMSTFSPMQVRLAPQGQDVQAAEHAVVGKYMEVWYMVLLGALCLMLLDALRWF